MVRKFILSPNMNTQYTGVEINSKNTILTRKQLLRDTDGDVLSSSEH